MSDQPGSLRVGPREAGDHVRAAWLSSQQLRLEAHLP